MADKRQEQSRISDLVQGHLSPAEALRLLDEVERDPALSRMLEERIALTELVRSEEVRGVFAVRDLSRGGVGDRLRGWLGGLWSWVRRPRYAFVAGLLLLVSMGWWGVERFVGRIPASYAVHLRVMDEELALRLRSFSDVDLSIAAGRIVAGEYREAAEGIERFLRMHPEDELVPWAEHVSGIVHIVGGCRRVWGVGIVVDRREVEVGIARLAGVRGVIGAEAVEEEGLWYEAMGWLLLEEEGRARELLGRVVGMSGDREEEARDLLEEVSHRNE